MFFLGQDLKNIHVRYTFLEFLTFFWLTLLDIYCLEFISHHKRKKKKYCVWIQTPKKIDQELNAKRHTFSFVSDIVPANLMTIRMNKIFPFLACFGQKLNFFVRKSI